MAIYWCGENDVPVCDVTGQPVDECDHISVDDACVDNHCPQCGEFDAECVCYDARDEWDLADKQAREEADRV